MESLEVTSTHSSEFDGSSVVEDEGDSANAYFDRVRVDRKKLEEMLQETGPGVPTLAFQFFKQVMDETDTVISWPVKLKTGAKSKKDPHVKVMGTPEAVDKARERILEELDSKKNRVTLKMDVSFTDHSYIIGKGGHNIQQVMDNTGCHIHFPDSNRNSNMDKSNQVSIAGQPRAVESARSQIRELLPMVVSFELPLGLAVPTALDPSSMALQGILKSHGITVTFRPTHAAAALVVVKGSRRYVDRLRQGLSVLVEYLTGGSRTQVGVVTLRTEIAPQHHAFVMGRGSCNVHQIAQQTGCVITFPDPSMSHAAAPQFLGQQGPYPISKSTVQITGHFDAVHNAWLELLSWLPLVLMFDLKDGQETDSFAMLRLMDQLNVHISVKPKPKRSSRCIVARCAERDSRLLFEVRRILLGLDTDELGSPPPVDVVPHMPPPARGHHVSDRAALWMELQATFAQQKQAAAAAAARQQQQQQRQQQQLFWSGLLTGPPYLGPTHGAMASPVYQQHQQQAALLPLLLSQLSMGLRYPAPPAALESPAAQAYPYGSHVAPPERLLSPEHCGSSSLSHSSSRESPVDSGYGFSSRDEGHQHCNSDEGSSYHGWEGSVNGRDDEDLWKKNHGLRSATTPSAARDCSPKQQWENASVSCCPNIRPVGCERKVTFYNPLPSADFEKRKLLATKAMQEPVGSSKRVPSSTWAGLGFSKSMPESLIKKQFQMTGGPATISSGRAPKLQETKACATIDQTSPSQVWNDPADCLGAVGGCGAGDWDSQPGAHNTAGAFSASNFFECVGAHTKWCEKLGPTDIPHLFSLLGLGKYVDIFQRNEIDLEAFLHMTDSDLQQLYIPYAARKKMLLAISDINLVNIGAFSRCLPSPTSSEHQVQNQSPPQTMQNDW